MRQEIKHTIIALSAFAAAATIWMWGYSVGDGKGTSLVELVKEDRDRLRHEVGRLSSEAESLKIQLSASINSPQNLAITSSVIESASPQSTEDFKNQILSEERSIRAQNTEVFFGGSIEITLIATDFSGSPLRHKVLANVLIPGSEPFEIRNADPGSAFKVGGFQVVVVNSGTLSATFKVFKLET